MTAYQQLKTFNASSPVFPDDFLKNPYKRCRKNPVSCYMHSDGTFDLEIHAVVVWGGGNLYNLDDMESEMIFYKTTKKFFSQLIQYLKKVCITSLWQFL